MDKKQILIRYSGFNSGTKWICAEQGTKKHGSTESMLQEE